MIKPISILFLLLILASPLAHSENWTPTRLTLTAPHEIYYDFDGEPLQFTVNVSGTPAKTVFCVFTKDQARNIIDIQNGYLGWHYVNKIDTCIYYNKAVDNALQLGNGTVIISYTTHSDKRKKLPKGSTSHQSPVTSHELRLSSRFACTACNLSFDPPSPQMFSFNSPTGMCPTCDGLGESFDFDPDRLVPDPSKSFLKNAIEPMHTKIGRWRRHIFEGVARHVGFDLNTPWKNLSAKARDALLYGTGEDHITFEWRWRGGIWKHGDTFEGIIAQLHEKYRNTKSSFVRAYYEKYMHKTRCPDCQGMRLNPQASAVILGGKNLPQVEALAIDQLAGYLDRLRLDQTQMLIAEDVLREIRARLTFLLSVGLHYLTLDRPAPTLSGGEAQRIRLASQIGSGLTGVLYILDEPSIGLHQRDQRRLLESLQELRDRGNTVVVVEHDEDTMRTADHIIDFGPGPGVRGGDIVSQGNYNKIAQSKKSLTADYLTGRLQIDIPKQRKPVQIKTKTRKKKTSEQQQLTWLTVRGARHNNLKKIDVAIPLGRFVCITGVSGSGKSSLVMDILREQLMHDLNGAEKVNPGLHRKIDNIECLDKVIDIDQSPIGRTPRSNPATYIKVFDHIRDLYTRLPDAKVRGYRPGRFSFNVPTGKKGGGRCEACEGNGANKLKMEFLADLWITCPVCDGKRFNRETLQILYKGKSIADVLDMDVQQALTHFDHQSRISRMLQTLHDVGLDYIKLGQSATTLSGGEAQRIKLARELVKRSTGKTLYILDEPTTGLHFDDIKKLLAVLHDFVDAGNTVLIVEHNLDVIKTADWVIDLGPEGGEGGGNIVAQGTPEDIAQCNTSYTGIALKDILFPGKNRNHFINTKSGTARAKARGSDVYEMRSNMFSGDPKGSAKTTVKKAIRVVGAAENNLKNVSVDIPHHKTTVFTGLSGSGKTSLAMDILYTEGHRRYVESLSAYARQFLGQLQKPRVEHIEGLAPAIAIEQKSAGHSPAIDGRHGDRNLRLPPHSLRAPGPAALPQVRQADRSAVGGPDHRTHSLAAQRHEGHTACAGPASRKRKVPRPLRP